MQKPNERQDRSTRRAVESKGTKIPPSWKRYGGIIVLAWLLSGCTIMGGPGFDVETGTYAFLIDLDDDGWANGIWSGCYDDTKCGGVIPKAQWLPREGW